MSRIKQLKDRKAALLAEAKSINAKIDAGTATEAEKARVDEIVADGGDMDKVNKDIKTEERLMDERRTMDANAAENEDTTEERRTRVEVVKPTEKFTGLGEQLRAIAHAGQKGVHESGWDKRLVPLYQPGGLSAAAQGANESVPSEGGFLVQNDLGAPMIESLFTGGDILSRVRRPGSISSNANGMVIPALDETSRANGSRFGGVQVYWANEATAVTGTKPKFRNMELKLNKLFGLAYSTDELLADSTLLEGIFGQAFNEEMTFKLEDGVINGTGAGQLLGILNSGALISVAAESGQAADTIVTANVLKMFNRLPPRSLTSAVWLINQEALPQIQQLTLGSGTAVVRLYSVPGDSGNNLATAAGTLLGRPVLIAEQSAAIGDVGDILLLDLNQYVMIDKGAIKQASSIHVQFLTDETAFRWTYRVDGQPIQRSAITPFKGAASRSPYVALAAR